MVDTRLGHDDRRERKTQRAWTMAQRAHFILELLSAVGSLILVAFFALGFQFKTPAKWLEETNVRITETNAQIRAVADDFHVVRRQQSEDSLKTSLNLRIQCSKLTRPQLDVVPLCDLYRVRNFPKTGGG